jgi:hypothetical protein
VQTTWRRRKYIHAQDFKSHNKICFIKNHNLHDKNKIIMFKYTINLQSYFVFKTHFHWIIAKVITWFHICFTHNIYIIARNHTLFSLKKKEVKVNLNIMHNIVIIPSWLFPHTKFKRTFSFSPFALAYILLLTIFFKMSTDWHEA